MLKDFFKNLRGWMIFVAIILALRWLLSLAVFAGTLGMALGFGGFFSADFAGSFFEATVARQIYIAISLIMFAGLLLLETMVLSSFLKRKKSCSKLFLWALFLGVLSQGVDLALQELLFDEPVEFIGSMAGIVMALGIFQYMSTSKRGKMFFVND